MGPGRPEAEETEDAAAKDAGAEWVAEWTSEGCAHCGWRWDAGARAHRCPRCHFLYCTWHEAPLRHACVDVAWGFNGERI